MNDTKGTVLFGLSYTHDRKWLAIAGYAGGVEDLFGWEPHTTYRVVLQMDYDEWTAFLDQREIDRKSYNEDLFDSHRISHFYIGGDGKDRCATGGHVTVTNVMLYNDDLYNNELYKLNASKVTIPSLGVEEHPTGQVTSTEVSVVSESKSEEIVTSCAELNEDDPDKQEEETASMIRCLQRPLPRLTRDHLFLSLPSQRRAQGMTVHMTMPSFTRAKRPSKPRRMKRINRCNGAQTCSHKTQSQRN
ncbi:trans-sialidase [Trypanosoma cruzi]|nr:trans-sialidase [Trypanosoma cruzi]